MISYIDTHYKKIQLIREFIGQNQTENETLKKYDEDIIFLLNKSKNTIKNIIINKPSLLADDVILKHDKIDTLNENQVKTLKDYMLLNGITWYEPLFQDEVKKVEPIKLKLVKLNDKQGWDKLSHYVYDLKTLKPIGKKDNKNEDMEELNEVDIMTLKLKGIIKS